MSNNQHKYDVLVIGAGPGGYVAAIRAAQLGLNTAIVESTHLGGICLNWGCIPTKAMLKGADVLNYMQKSSVFGIFANEIEFDISKLVKHSRDVSNKLTSGIEYLLNKNNITVFNGFGKLVGKGKVEITPTELKRPTFQVSAMHTIIATGAKPKMLPNIERNQSSIWTYFEALNPSKVPESLLVIGSGAIGVEFASMYSDFGTDVTIVELASRILPNEDPDVSDYMQKSFSRRGIRSFTSSSLSDINYDANSFLCSINSGSDTKSYTFEKVLVAVGVEPNTKNIGLEACGVVTERGFIKTDAVGKTNVVGVYAIGDVAGAPCLAHKASHQAVSCVEAIAGVANAHPVNLDRVPGCTYCRPNIASLGLTEPQAREAGKSFNVGRFDLSANGKALGNGDSEGFIKILIDNESEEVLGAHFVGHEVTEQIQGIGLAMSSEATLAEFEQTIFAHPTISEAIHEAILDTQKRAIHK